jgi:hypothetical protein
VIALSAQRREISAHFARPASISLLRRAVLMAALVFNAVFLVAAVQGFLFAPGPRPDWQGVVLAAERIAAGTDPYVGQVLAYRWSPLAAWLFVPIAAAGFAAWQLLHFAALAALPMRLAAVTLACFAFWVDAGMGNVVVFGFVLAYLALSGSRLGVLGFAVLALLVPRPLYIPVLIWVWMRQPEMRKPLILVAAIVAVLTVATGYAPSWLAMLASSTNEITNPTNLAPSRFIGMAWAPVGIAAGLVALRRGRVGLASLLFSPYWLPYYFVMILLDLKVGDRTTIVDALRALLPKRHVARLGHAARA